MEDEGELSHDPKTAVGTSHDKRHSLSADVKTTAKTHRKPHILQDDDRSPAEIAYVQARLQHDYA